MSAPTPVPGARGLDALNALVAGGQTGFGAFIAVHLTAQAWTQGDIGQALAVGTVVAMASQVPAGALVDRMRSKRLAIAFGGGAVACSALLFAATAARLPVLLAEVLHGFASCMIGPAIAAISLQLAGHAGLGERLGRNARFASIGSAASALALGGIGTWGSGRAVFWATAAMMAAGLLVVLAAPSPMVALPAPGAAPPAPVRLRALLDRRLLAFAACVAGFHLSNAAMLPLVAGEVTRAAGSRANLVIAACIVAPQAIVALASPLVGRRAGIWGRRPVLLLGFAALPLRGVLLALDAGPAWVVAVQALDGISAAALGVLMPLVAADLTRSGGFSAALGVLGLAAGAGATLSTGLAGLVADRFGPAAALLALAAAGAAAMAGLLAVPETRPLLARNPGTVVS
jgi:MFS family permease